MVARVISCRESADVPRFLSESQMPHRSANDRLTQAERLKWRLIVGKLHIIYSCLLLNQTETPQYDYKS